MRAEAQPRSAFSVHYHLMVAATLFDVDGYVYAQVLCYGSYKLNEVLAVAVAARRQ